MPNVLTVPIIQGTDENWNLTANTSFGPASGGASLLQTDTYTAELWVGGNATVMLTPTVTWLTISTFNLALTAAQSLLLQYGVSYPVNVYRHRGSAKNGIATFFVLCLPAPKS